jgi:hypothetical protein
VKDLVLAFDVAFDFGRAEEGQRSGRTWSKENSDSKGKRKVLRLRLTPSAQDDSGRGTIGLEA